MVLSCQKTLNSRPIIENVPPVRLGKDLSVVNLYLEALDHPCANHGAGKQLPTFTNHNWSSHVGFYILIHEAYTGHLTGKVVI